ncbi:Flavin-containing monooxygenase FMO GS-OX-like 4 [Sesamum angolense]|uniref:Flavin-containing monooxygenase n=1 Tax=Sesamum angolense TaxID=2727404 RepID=A0AAE1W9Y7_9LAMI|nr:Flavin-containing monooxygenase FMO GS-OX-like 4 [Sesamum angolense]
MAIPNPNPNSVLHFRLPAMPSPVSRNVAVIGAGAAGLCAALELRRDGHKVVVYEKENQIGGTWAYTPEIETDPIGLDPTRNIVQSSLYASLRTNLPREVMGFRVYPFVASRKPGRDGRRFPGHGEVLEYLRDFAEEFRLGELVRFGSEVWHVGLVEDRKWMVRSRKRSGSEGNKDDEVYDAVVVCNGHYTEPRIAEIPAEKWNNHFTTAYVASFCEMIPVLNWGTTLWKTFCITFFFQEFPELLEHKLLIQQSTVYKSPYSGFCFHFWCGFQLGLILQIVVVIGSAASADDISRDISKVAKEVHITSRSIETGRLGKLSGHDNIWLHSMINSVHKDGKVAFQDGTQVRADVILHCTGWSKWIAGVLSGRIPLPSKEEMMTDTEALYSSLEASGIPYRYTHRLGADQFEYDDWLAAKSGSPLTEEWRKEMYFAAGRRKRSMPEMRDQWDDEDLISQAYEDFKQHSNCGLRIASAP